MKVILYQGKGEVRVVGGYSDVDEKIVVDGRTFRRYMGAAVHTPPEWDAFDHAIFILDAIEAEDDMVIDFSETASPV